jgi:hypothetical protein
MHTDFGLAVTLTSDRVSKFIQNYRNAQPAANELTVCKNKPEFVSVRTFYSHDVHEFVDNCRKFGSARNQETDFAVGTCMAFVTNFRDFARHQQHLLEDLLAESDRYFHPFVDPLRSDMMLPALFSGQREEVYSDMLVWVLKLLPTNRQIFEILGIPEVEFIQNEPLQFSREVYIHEGDRTGRLDVLISQAGRWLVVLELKTKGYDETDLAKHEFYNVAIGNTALECACEKIFIAPQYTGA